LTTGRYIDDQELSPGEDDRDITPRQSQEELGVPMAALVELRIAGVGGGREAGAGRSGTSVAAMAPGTATTLRPSLKRKAPGTRRERDLWELGHQVVVGIDEVGRGAWAGPLTLGAVVIPKDKRLTKVRDSKMLTEPEREVMYERIVEWADAWSVGHAWPDECDELGMSEAQRLAARRAIEGLGIVPDQVLLDGNWDFVGSGNVTKIVKGDATCLSIAAASIVAKVTRDRMMRECSDAHPWWSFDTNKGYPCPRHKTALAGVGPSAIHRRSWVFMEHLPWQGAVRSVPIHLRPDDSQGTLFA
jgi:ribonuclease HII